MSRTAFIGALVDSFAAQAAAAPGAPPFLHQHIGTEHDRHLVIGVCTHGDEVGPLPAAVALTRDLRSGALRFGGRLTVVLGNPEATRAGLRALDSDLNRVFVDEPPDDREGRRARSLKPVLETADIFLDLHQTGQPTTEAFYTLPYREDEACWVRALAGARTWLTRPWGQAFSPGTCCADEFVRTLGRPGITLELSQKGLSPASQEAATAIMRRLLTLVDDDALGRRSIAAAAQIRPELSFLETVHREPFGDPRRRLRPGLCNLQPVHKDQRLSPADAPVVTSPVAGRLLFPSYPPRDEHGRVAGPVPGELFRVAVEMGGHPRDVWG